jgi:hypothetical protein
VLIIHRIGFIYQEESPQKVNIEQVGAKKSTECKHFSVVSYSQIVQKSIWGSIPNMAK